MSLLAWIVLGLVPRLLAQRLVVGQKPCFGHVLLFQSSISCSMVAACNRRTSALRQPISSA